MNREPSSHILDQNLAQLLTRSYEPVQPRAAFVRDLERTLEPWLTPAGARRVLAGPRAPRRAWPLAIGAFAAAAALLLTFFVLHEGDRPGGGGAPGLRDVGGLVAAGEVAVRFTDEDGSPGAWRPATVEERSGLELPASGGVEMVTPAGAAARLVGAAWEVALDSESALTATVLSDRIGFRCTAGAVRADAGDGARTFAASSAGSQHFYYVGSLGRFVGAQDPPPGVDDPAAVGQREAIGETDAPEQPLADEASATSGLAQLEGTLHAPEDGPALDGGEVYLLRRLELPQVAFPTRLDFVGATFTWDGVEPGEYSVFVDLPGYAMWKGGRITLEADATTAVEVEPALGVRVRGFVIDPATGDAVQGALVVSETAMPLQAVGSDPAQFGPVRGGWTLSGQDGSFELPDLARGDHRLRASSDDFAPTWLSVDAAADPTDGVVFELREGGVVEGRCEHPDGRPFEGAQIIVSRFSAGRTDETMTFDGVWTDAEGRYRVDHLAPGFCVVLYFTENAEQGEFQPQYRPVGIREGETARIDFLGEERGGSIFGVVRDGEGQPVPFANLHVWSPGLGEASWIGDTADGEGRFEVLGLEPGDYQLYAGSASNTVFIANVTLEPGERYEQDVSLSGRTLEVLVEDLVTGAPLNFIDLSLIEAGGPSLDVKGYSRMSARVFSSSEGRVQLRHLPDGDYDLYVVPETSAYAMAILPGVRISAETEDEKVRVQLRPAGSLALTVRDVDGVPLAGAKVELTGPTGDVWSYPWTPLSDAEGRAILDRLAEGSWRVRVEAPGFRPAVVTASVIAGEATALDVTLRSE